MRNLIFRKFDWLLAGVIALSTIPAGAVFDLGLAGAHADTLRISGTGATLATMQAVGAAFSESERIDPIDIETLPSLGSAGGIRAVGDGVISVAVTSRPPNPTENTVGLQATAIGVTPIAFVSSNPQPGGLVRADLPEIYRREKLRWADGSEIRIILRPPEGTTEEFLKVFFPNLVRLYAGLRQRGIFPIASTDQENVALASDIKGSLTIVTMAQMRGERLDLHVLPLDGIWPNLETLESGSHRFALPLYLVHRTSDNTAQRFLAFLRSPAGAEILHRNPSSLSSRPRRSAREAVSA